MADAAATSLLAAGRSSDPERAAKAIDEYRKIGTESAVLRIAQQAPCPDLTVRTAVVSALGAVGRDYPDIAGPALVELLVDSDDYIRAEAADALGKIRYTESASLVAERLRNDTNAIVRAAAAETLGDLGDVETVPDLVNALADGDRAVRGYAANALGLVGTPDIVPELERIAAMEPSPATRGEMLGALYRLGADGALASLVQLLRTADAGLAPNLLNTVEDLVSRRPLPASLPTDAPMILGALRDLGHRVASVAAHASAISARLAAASQVNQEAALRAHVGGPDGW